MPKTATSMKPLYERLKSQGFDRPYVQSAILPDWWEDSLFDNESNRLTAQMSIANFLGVKIQHLRDPDAALLPPLGNIRLKRAKNAPVSDVSGAITAALHAARLTAKLMRNRLPFTGVRPALEIRNQLLSRPDCTWPDLPNLVDYCWQHGIAVVHLTRQPKNSKSIAGLATYIEGRPVIVLCSKRDSQAWLAFHLAHEIGHIMTKHVKPGDAPLVDVKLDGFNEELQEQQADEYAFQVLTGLPTLKLKGVGLTGPKLVRAARQYGREHRMHPGTVALIYGYGQRRMGVAQAALNLMSEDEGAGAILARAYRRHVPLDEASESAQRALAATTQIFGVAMAAQPS